MPTNRFEVTLLILGLCLGHSSHPVKCVCLCVCATKLLDSDSFIYLYIYFACVPALIRSNKSAH